MPPMARKKRRRAKSPLTFCLLLAIAVALRVLWMPPSGLDYLELPSSLPGLADSSPMDESSLWTTHTDPTTNRTTYRHAHFHVPFPLCLIHIGKTAGSTISCGLGLTYADCEGPPREKLRHTHYFHLRKNTCPPKQTATNVVTLRNPLVRLQSWFDFEKTILPSRGRDAKTQAQIQKQRGMLFQCFPNFSEFVQGLLEKLPTDDLPLYAPNMTCPERAWAAALGVRAFSYHEWYNYEYYWTGIQELQRPKAPMYVLRTEHLAQDWASLSTEPLFRAVNQGTRDQNHTLPTPKRTLKFLDTARANPADEQLGRGLAELCKALCPEIQVYRQFLEEAINLNAHQKEESIQEVQAYCPDIRSNCPDIPVFPRMPVPPRQYKTEVKKRLFEVKRNT